MAKNIGVRLTGAAHKVEMVARLLGMASIGAMKRIIDDGDRVEGASDDELVVPVALSYITKDVLSASKALPPFKDVTIWTKDLANTTLKEFTFMNLLVYLVYCRDKTFDMDSMRAFKSLKAYEFFYDGYVHNVWTHLFPESSAPVVYVHGFVHHSLSSDLPLEVFVAVNGENGDVYSAKCNCVSGLGEACSHVAALLFYLEHHSGKDVLPTDLSKTSKPMEWNRPSRKEIAAAPASEIAFVKPAHGAATSPDNVEIMRRSDFDPRRAQDRVVEESSLAELVKALKKTYPESGLVQFCCDCPDKACRGSGSKSGIVTPLSATLTDDKVLLSDFVLFDPDEKDCTKERCREIAGSGFVLPPGMSRAIEERTRGQANNKFWHLLHNGRLTSSRFGEILHRRKSTDPYRLVRDIMSYRGGMVGLTPAIRWSMDNEDAARKRYVESQKAKGEAMEVRDCGLTLLETKSFLGASSDGLVLCHSADTNTVGCLEIKPIQH